LVAKLPIRAENDEKAWIVIVGKEVKLADSINKLLAKTGFTPAYDH
jgi:hypothetical protein